MPNPLINLIYSNLHLYTNLVPGMDHSDNSMMKVDPASRLVLTLRLIIIFNNQTNV